MNNGYKEVLAKEHPSSRKSGWMYEHRLEASKMLRRPLKPSEHVHHCDEDRTNNNHSNLIVFASNADHVRFHRIGIAYLQEDGAFSTVSVDRRSLALKRNRCILCNKPCSRKFCSLQCADVGRRKVERPSKEQLQLLLQENSFVAAGRMFGVSDNAVKKWAVDYGIYVRKRAIR